MPNFLLCSTSVMFPPRPELNWSFAMLPTDIQRLGNCNDWPFVLESHLKHQQPFDRTILRFVVASILASDPHDQIVIRARQQPEWNPEALSFADEIINRPLVLRSEGSGAVSFANLCSGPAIDLKIALYNNESFILVRRPAALIVAGPTSTFGRIWEKIKKWIEGD